MKSVQSSPCSGARRECQENRKHCPQQRKGSLPSICQQCSSELAALAWGRCQCMARSREGMGGLSWLIWQPACNPKGRSGVVFAECRPSGSDQTASGCFGWGVAENRLVTRHWAGAVPHSLVGIAERPKNGNELIVRRNQANKQSSKPILAHDMIPVFAAAVR